MLTYLHPATRWMIEMRVLGKSNTMPATFRVRNMYSTLDGLGLMAYSPIMAYKHPSLLKLRLLALRLGDHGSEYLLYSNGKEYRYLPGPCNSPLIALTPNIDDYFLKGLLPPPKW